MQVLLDWDEIRSILSLYHLEGLEAFGGINERSERASYWVRVAGRRYVLRVSSRRRFSDMVFEKDLMIHLGRAGLPVPRVIENVASGAFTPWESRGHYVSLFQFIEGRQLGVFEIRARHVRQVAAFLAEMHLRCERFHGQKRGDSDIVETERYVDRVSRALTQRRLPLRHEPAVRMLEDEMARQAARAPSSKAGIGHGALFVEAVKFHGDLLSAVLDFEAAGRERFTLDLAIAINAWCWEPSSRQRGGPAGRFNRAKVRAFIKAYEGLRPLGDAGRAELAADLRLAALRFAASRIASNELRRAGDERPYRDYRHFTARLEALRHGAAERFVDFAG